MGSIAIKLNYLYQPCCHEGVPFNKILSSSYIFYYSWPVKKNLDKKESEIPNDSPNFLILEEVADTSSLTDTALALNDIQFVPDNTYDSIIWTIDNGSFRRKEKILRLKFLQEGIYNVKMTGYRFALVLDSSISESVIKTIHIVNREEGSNYLGDFKGYLTEFLILKVMKSIYTFR